ncbi:AraC family transcriptional regulator [Aliiruegeria lutimaris]|uniref:Transcriptional regulator, AraC family n=1 Tax=Aliiruegeria lutimaris TaxID=571298 RepID=A0A1G8MQY9_9RHOB|nr:AraC family transcriptional regulator [Aliiruegeria lutimaris]SDI70468.1 transcriptional regulator, AraC family [Aliiruegeria lutimaris]
MISAFYARKQIEQAVNVPDVSALYDIVSLTPESAADPTAMIHPDDYHSLMEAIAASEWPDLRFHMRVCAGMRCDEFGAFGLAIKSAPTLRHSLKRIGRYTRLHNQISEFVALDRGEVFCWTHRKPWIARLGSHLSNEAALATTLTLCREATTPSLTPVRVQFVHRREGSIAALVEHFGIEPVFGAELDGMQFAIEEIDKPTAVGDPGIWQFFTDHLESLLQAEEQQPDLPLDTRVVEEIAKLLSGGVPPLAEVAMTLGMGARTLQRRLAERGTTYQALVDEARRQLAHQLVGGSQYALSEIAFLTGFSEQSAFISAFKRWEGQTPRAFRQAGAAGSGAG